MINDLISLPMSIVNSTIKFILRAFEGLSVFELNGDKSNQKFYPRSIGNQSTRVETLPKR